MIPVVQQLRRSALCLLIMVSFLAQAHAQQQPLRLAKLTEGAGIETQLGELYGPLGRKDADLYSRIFREQREGHWRQANKFIDRLGNRLLMGHVNAQRYLHPTAYRSSFVELRDWMAEYADHPQAATIYKLAMKRRPNNAKKPVKPVPGYLSGSGQELVEEHKSDYESTARRSKAVSRDVRNWLGKIRKLVSRDRPTQAAKLLSSSGAKTCGRC